MYQGHDGYELLMGKHCFVDDESGMNMSTIVRKFLLGASLFCFFKGVSYISRSHLRMAAT